MLTWVAFVSFCLRLRKEIYESRFTSPTKGINIGYLRNDYVVNEVEIFTTYGCGGAVHS